MKKIFLLSIALLFALTSYGQDLDLGLKAGLNLANVSSDEEGYESDMKAGIHVGAFANLRVSDGFGIQPELIYSMQGASFEQMGQEGDMNLDYLNIPVMANIYLTDGLSFNVGPQFGFLLNGEASIGDLDVDISDEMNSISLAVGAGLTYELPMGLVINGRYNLGLTDVTENYDDPDFGAIEDKSTNQVIQVSVGYKLF